MQKKQLLILITIHSYDVTYDLVIAVASALMTFSLEFEGKSFGTVEAKFS